MREVYLSKDDVTGLVVVYLPPSKEGTFTFNIMNPMVFKGVCEVGYLFTLDPAINNDLVIPFKPTELQGSPIDLSSVDKFKQSVRDNIGNMTPYRDTPSWKKLYDSILVYRNDTVDEKTHNEYMIVKKQVESVEPPSTDKPN